MDHNKPFHVVLMGYQSRHTNWFPWNRFYKIFYELDYLVSWVQANELHKLDAIPGRRIFICWNEPTTLELIKSGKTRKEDIFLQKLTSLGKGMNRFNWGKDPLETFKNWRWPLYKTVEDLYDRGFNIFGFGCRTITEPFPEKHRICNKIKHRIFWITWGSTAFNREEIEDSDPITSGFEYDLGFVGSKWGVKGRGNIDQWEAFMDPIIKGRNTILRGSGLGGQVNDDQMKVILRKCKLCPIIHAPSWVAEHGIQDRFYTVFTSGRFGVVDNEGVYDLFESDEVVCEVNPERYVEKSCYYMENVKEQFPYIEKVQRKIKEKYNFYQMWYDIIEHMKLVEYRLDDQEFESMVNNVREEFNDAFTVSP